MTITKTSQNRFEILGFIGRSAIVNNLHDGAYVTILNGKRVDVFAKFLCPSAVDRDFLDFLRVYVSAGSCGGLVEWLKDSTPEDVEAVRVMYGIGNKAG